MFKEIDPSESFFLILKTTVVVINTTTVIKIEDFMQLTNNNLNNQTPFLIETVYAQANYQKLMVDRGNLGSHMKTIGLHIEAKRSENYTFDKNGVRVSTELFPVDLEARAANPIHATEPPNLEIPAVWEDKAEKVSSLINIFGDASHLYVNSTELTIPSVEATDEYLAFYGATLVKQGDTFFFPHDFPLFLMDMGERYCHDFVMSDGGGTFLEYHYDQPHFHMPLQGGGHYILAKWNDEKTHLKITGFRIPNESAIYSKKGAIHTDTCLNGSLIVGYDSTEDFSTALLRNSQNANEKVNFIFE